MRNPSKRACLVTIILAVVAGIASPAPAEDGSEVDAFLGVWDTVTQTLSGPVEGELTCELVDGELVVTEATHGQATEVSYADNALNFVLDIGGTRHNVVTEVEGDTFDGKIFVGGTSFCNFEEMYEITGTRRTTDS